MNQVREDLKSRETEIAQAIDGDALRRACSVTDMIREAPTMPFYRAYDQAAIALAREHGITEAGAKEMMRTAFAGHEELSPDRRHALIQIHLNAAGQEYLGCHKARGPASDYGDDAIRTGLRESHVPLSVS